MKDMTEQLSKERAIMMKSLSSFVKDEADKNAKILFFFKRSQRSKVDLVSETQ